MPNPLDPVWNGHRTSTDAFTVVRRSLGLDVAARAHVVQGAQFEAAADQQILDRLDAAQDEIDDQAVMFLYATFEATLRDHIVAHAGMLIGATHPTAQFGRNCKHGSPICAVRREWTRRVCTLKTRPVWRHLEVFSRIKCGGTCM